MRAVTWWFATASLLLAACVGDPAVGSVEQNTAVEPWATAGGKCHVYSGHIIFPIIFGTMTAGNECCGLSYCDDEQVCGANYNKWTEWCASCDSNACNDGWVKPATGSGLVLLVTSESSQVYVKEEKGYEIPFTPTVKK